VKIRVICGLIILAASIGFFLRDVAYDDPYITYRYARNILTGGGFVYNPGERVLSTTAPLYTVLLAAGGLFWPDIPHLSNILSALSLLGAGAFIYLLLWERRDGKWTGVLAGALLILSPLLLMTFGFEMAFFTMLVCGAFYFWDKGTSHLTRKGRGPLFAAALLALALLTRGDGFLPALVLFGWWAWREKRLPWREAALYLLIVLPFFAWLTVLFGLPLPATLSAKKLQMQMGLTGFYPGSTFLSGLAILAGVFLRQSLLYLLFIPALGLGLLSLKDERWVWPFWGWAGLHLLGYALLGVAPYHWYYAALAPALALTAALGAARLGQWRYGRVPALLLALGLFVAEVTSARAIYLATMGAPIQTEKGLPEAKAFVYRQVGQWLREKTGPEETVGMMEVGIIGYYSQRRVVDFLGLIQPEIARALSYRNLYWAIPHYLPDYIVLTRQNPLYSYYLGEDQWFKKAYIPVKIFADQRFYAGPVTVYKRKSAPRPMEEHKARADFGGVAYLLGYRLEGEAARPGQAVRLSLLWQAAGPIEREYSGFVHLVDEGGNIVAQEDESYATSLWPPGEVVEYYHNLALPEDIPSGQYAILVGMYIPGVEPKSAGERLIVQETGQDAAFIGHIFIGR
jgi:hypothetical protein